MKKTKKLKILEASLIKKQDHFNEKLQNHFDTVAMANGQPLNDKRNGQPTLNKWERQNDSLRNLKTSIEKTAGAIEREKGKIMDCEEIEKELPSLIIEMMENGILVQWRKHPNTFFVNGVEKARIVWNKKKEVVAHRYLNEITDKEQWAFFAKVYNELNREK